MALITVSNALELGFSAEEVLDEIKSLLKSKHWSKTDKPELTLSYIPYYVFRYVSYTEESDEESKKPAVVTETNQGTFVLDGITGELETEFSDNLQNPTLVPFEKSTEESEFDIDIEKPKVSNKEAEKIALLQTAKNLGLPKKNVEITSLKLVYVPVWIASVSIPEGDFELEYSGVDGELLSEDTIPEREKARGELAGEAVGELTSPSKWGEYFSNLVKDIYESEHLRSIGKFLIHDTRGRIILTIIIVYLILRLLGFRWP